MTHKVDLECSAVEREEVAADGVAAGSAQKRLDAGDEFARLYGWPGSRPLPAQARHPSSVSPFALRTMMASASAGGSPAARLAGHVRQPEVENHERGMRAAVSARPVSPSVADDTM